jgi:hypothetical protein
MMDFLKNYVYVSTVNSFNLAAAINAGFTFVFGLAAVCVLARRFCLSEITTAGLVCVKYFITSFMFYAVQAGLAAGVDKDQAQQIYFAFAGVDLLFVAALWFIHNRFFVYLSRLALVSMLATLVAVPVQFLLGVKLVWLDLDHAWPWLHTVYYFFINGVSALILITAIVSFVQTLKRGSRV